MSSESPCYISRCKCGCNAIVFVTVDEPQFAKSNAKEIAKKIRDGYSVERMTVLDARKQTFGCAKAKRA